MILHRDVRILYDGRYKTLSYSSSPSQLFGFVVKQIRDNTKLLLYNFHYRNCLDNNHNQHLCLLTLIPLPPLRLTISLYSSYSRRYRREISSLNMNQTAFRRVSALLCDILCVLCVWIWGTWRGKMVSAWYLKKQHQMWYSHLRLYNWIKFYRQNLHSVNFQYIDIKIYITGVLYL